MGLSSKKNELMLALQHGLPLEPRPFAKFAEAHGISEEEILGMVKGMFKRGEARRLGGILDAKRLGYRSTLCAMKLDGKDRRRTISAILRHKGITHCYIRGWPAGLKRGSGSFDTDSIPNLWFTYTAPGTDFEKSLDCFRKEIGNREFLVLPSIQKFKVEVIFSAGPEKNNGRTERKMRNHPGSEILFSAADKKLIRLIQGSLPLVAEPFREISLKAGMSEGKVLEKLESWKRLGILRRIGLIVRHQKIGFSANAMCVWNVPHGEVVSAGKALARLNHVTHCYERESSPSFPYNLYAMIYSDSWNRLQRLFCDISRTLGLGGGLMLCSLEECKKTSPEYFT